MTPLETAHHAFHQWLRELDSELATASIAFEEFSGAAKLGDMKAAGEALERAERAVKNSRARIATGLTQKP